MRREPSANDPIRAIALICRLVIAAIWAYQGLVPKLLGPHADELVMGAAFGLEPALRVTASYSAGVAELGMAALILFLPRVIWPQVLSAAATLALLVFVMVFAPRYLSAAFNPVVMNGASIALSCIAIVAFKARADVTALQ